MERAENPYSISTDIDKIDIVAVHDFLSNHSSWCLGISIEIVASSIANSLNFGLFHKEKQIGFARVISDYSTIAYLGDVYILDAYRGKGLSKMLMDEVMSHPKLQSLRRWILLTSTADWLYKKYGFTPLPFPEIYMEISNKNMYK